MTYVLQNVVFPLDRDPDLLPLYADPETWTSVEDEPIRVSAHAHLGNVLGRHRARVGAGRRVSFGAYFNAFPASYWQHWTGVRQIALTVRTTGPATVLVYRSNGSGVRQRLAVQEVQGEATTTFPLSLTQYSDGGWIWFDLVADEESATLEHAVWTTEEEPVRAGLASIGITTFNKPDYCVRTLQALAEAPDVLELVDRVYLVDQGTQEVAGEPGYAEIAAALGERLVPLRQPNLGGSGGFARAMYETMQRGESDFVQLLDDDVQIEPESLRRSIVFGRFTTEPTLVGGHMFDLLDRAKLHGWAEVVDEAPFMWRNLYQESMPHDFGTANLRQSRLLHMRLDADYNGWWMCLIPVEAIRRVGLSLPAFIKWDDAEFCLRAGKAGFPTVSLPGVALWHVSWVNKDDSIDWQAYFHARNRILAGLLHSTLPQGGRLLTHSLRVDLKHLMMMQYYPAALRAKALRDLLSGPGHLRGSLRNGMPEARALAAGFPETQVHRDGDEMPRSRHGRVVFPPRIRPDADTPSGVRLRLLTLRILVSHWLRAPHPENVARPQVELGKDDAQWWRVSAYESALISTADGSGKTVYTRDRARFRRMLRESVRLHRQLKRRWPELQRAYRDALPDLVSERAWKEIFEEQE